MRDILPEKISKSHFYFKKNLKSQKGLQGNCSGGSQKNLKKSLFCRKKSQKISKSHFFVKKILKKQLFCQKKLKKSEWVAVAIPFCNTAVHHMSRVGCACGTFLATQLSIICPEWVAVAVPFLQHSCPS